MLAAILSNGRTSRFYTSIYEEQGLTRSAPDIWIGPGRRLDPLFLVSAEPKEPHTLEEVEAAIFAELERVKNEPVTSRELERVLNQMDAQLVRSMGSNIGLAFTLAMTLSSRGDWRAVMIDMERRREVTPEDIMHVAETYFTEENRTVGWLVETASEADEGEGEEEIDFRTLMQWAQTLPEEEQKELMLKFQTMSEGEREAFAKQLWERMKAEQGGN